MRLRLYSRKIRFFPAPLLENLRWGKEDASMEEIERACRIACADEFIDRLADGYDTEMGQGVSMYPEGRSSGFVLQGLS